MPGNKSSSRWAQLNYICDEVIQTLEKPSQGILLLIAFRHAHVDGTLRISTERLAEKAGMKRRYVRQLVEELVEAGILVVSEKGAGRVPTKYLIASLPWDERR